MAMPPKVGITNAVLTHPAGKWQGLCLSVVRRIISALISD
jgi:hypothetical protein